MANMTCRFIVLSTFCHTRDKEAVRYPISIPPIRNNPSWILRTHLQASLLACAQCPYPIDSVPPLVVSTWLTSFRKLCGPLCVVRRSVWMKRSGACFLGRRPASLLVSSMQQSGTTACCVVLSNEGVSTMNITVIVRTLTPLADAFDWPLSMNGTEKQR